MSSKTYLMATTALAVAIAAALVAAPDAYSAGKKQARAKANVPYGSRLKSIPQQQYDSFIISFHKGAAKPTAAALKQQLDVVGRGLGVRIAAVRVTGTGAQVIQTSRKLDDVEHKHLITQLSKHPSVRAVEANGRMYRAFEPNDPRYTEQWHYHDAPEGINVEGAWDAYDGTGITVAIVDTGRLNHADLPAFPGGYDMITDPANARDGDGRDDNPNDEGDWDDKYDSSWHATHVAGTIAASTDNNLGVAGVANGASVQHVRVLGNMGGTFEDVADGIIWASGGQVGSLPLNPTPADVINVSLGGGGACSTLMQDSIDAAVANGSIVVVAAGNSSGDVANFTPANCDGIITVAGTGPDNTPYASTNFGEEIEVAAPAGSGVTPATDQVLSTLNSGTEAPVPSPGGDIYQWYQGTSMATPHVVGTVALMLEAAGGPGSLTLEEATEILVNTGYDTNGDIPGCNTAGRWCSSLIDATKATAVADGSVPLPPAPPGPPPPPPPTELENGVAFDLGTMADEAEMFFYLDVPATATSLTFEMSPGTGATGDSDLYTRFGDLPDGSTYDCRPFTGGTVGEICSYPTEGDDPLPPPQEGRYYVRIHAWSASSGYSLTGTWLEGPDWALRARHVFALRGHRTRVLLAWETNESEQVDILYNGNVVATTANDGNFAHTFMQQGSGTVTYQACNAGSTSECSAEITVNYQSRP